MKALVYTLIVMIAGTAFAANELGNFDDLIANQRRQMEHQIQGATKLPKTVVTRTNERGETQVLYLNTILDKSEETLKKLAARDSEFKPVQEVAAMPKDELARDSGVASWYFYGGYPYCWFEALTIVPALFLLADV